MLDSSSEEILSKIQELLDQARVYISDKNYNRASHTMTEIEKLTWHGRLVIHELWKSDAANR